ncbi:MAG: glycosyltransferase family 39 protein, partial [Bacteroidetes bacterium]|nr:glycosyltransferase family 39 protein [Bacteroidota bacterium]
MKSKHYLILFLLLILAYFPIFSHLNTLPIRIWDESRLALNAYEMAQSGNLIVTSYEGEPDMWNTKPPLMIWMQAGLIKLIGLDELAIRLPSAIAVFFTCITLFIFSLRYLKSFWLGIIGILVLITSSGFVGFHTGRTGDYDAMLAFFIFSYCLFYYLFLEKGGVKYLYAFFAFLI